jgi:DNA-binding MarR family transcriptional regulator
MERMEPKKARRTAFLLAQVGAHAAKQFAARLAPLKLTPAHAGILRRLAGTTEMNQRTLAAQLGMHTSRMVGVVDEMESLGLVVRGNSTGDRRSYSLQVTPLGREKLKDISRVSQQHNEAMCAGLSEVERETLAEMLEGIASRQGLIPGVHPGFASLSVKKSRGSESSDD